MITATHTDNTPAIKFEGGVEGTFDWIRSKLQQAFNSGRDNEYYYVKDVFLDSVVVENERDSKHYEVDWAVDSSGNIALGDPMEVSLDYVAKARENSVFAPAAIESPVIKKNVARKLAYGAVMVPGEADSDGDVVSAEKISDVAHKFMEKYRYNDLMHGVGEPAAVPVESWIEENASIKMLGDNEVVYPAGTWFMAVKVHDSVWPDVESGKIRGFSIMAVLQTELDSMKSAVKSGASAEEVLNASMKRVTLKDLEARGEWGVPAVSLVDDPAVGKALFFAVKSKEPNDKPGILKRLFGGGTDVSDTIIASEKLGARNNNKDAERLKAAIAAISQVLNGADAGSHSKEDGKTEGKADSKADSKADEEKKKKNTGKSRNNEIQGEDDMAEVELSDLAAAIKSAVKESNEELLISAGVIKKEETPQEQLASVLTTVVKRLEALESGDVTANEDDEDDEVATKSEDDEDDAVTKRIKKLEKRLRSVSASSKGLDSDEETDEDDDFEDDDGRDMFGRRISPLKEVN